MIPKLLHYFPQKTVGCHSINDVEYLNGVVYIATLLSGVFGYELNSNGELPCWQSSFLANAMQIWGDSLISIGKRKVGLSGSEAVFQILDTRTGGAVIKPVTLPRKNYLKKYARRTSSGGEIIEDATETAPFLQKAIATSDKLYVLYRFSREKATVEGKIIRYDMEFGKDAILCVYTLPELKLLNHYDLSSSGASLFCLRYPYIFYYAWGEQLLCRLDMTTAQIQTAELTKSYAISCDHDFVYAGHGESISLFTVSDLSFFETIDLAGQMSEVNRLAKAEYDKVHEVNQQFAYLEREEKAKEHLRQRYSHPVELDGFVRMAAGYGERFLDIHGLCLCPERGMLAVATELGTSPGFLWDTQTRRPIAHLLGMPTVSRKIKIRYPYVLSCAYEDAHIWLLS